MKLTEKDKQGVRLIGIIFSIVTIIFIAIFVNSNKTKPDEDNCIGEVINKTVIVLDQTQSVSLQTKDEIKSRVIKNISENVSTNERVSIFSVSDFSKKDLMPRFSRCKPQDTSNNRFTENQKHIESIYKNNFLNPLEKVIDQDFVDSKESPIAQAIIDLSLSEYLRANKTNLIIFSDMLENTSEISMYKCISGDEFVQRYRSSRIGSQERPVFNNTKISLNIIPRNLLSRENDKCRTHYWAWFFGDGEHSIVTTDYLPGGL